MDERWGGQRLRHAGGSRERWIGIENIPHACNEVCKVFLDSPLSQSTTSPARGGGFGLDGLVEDAVEALDEGGWVFEWDAFEEEGLVEE